MFTPPQEVQTLNVKPTALISHSISCICLSINILVKLNVLSIFICSPILVIFNIRLTMKHEINLINSIFVLSQVINNSLLG